MTRDMTCDTCSTERKEQAGGIQVCPTCLTGHRDFDADPVVLPEPEGLSQARWDRYLSELIGAGTSLLDLHCGEGSRMAIASDHGCEVDGVEPNAYLAEKARDHGVVQRATADTMALARPYDTIMAIHVLDRVPEPHDTLERIEEACIPGTQLVAEVINLNAPLISGYRFNPEVPRGVSYRTLFTPKSLQNLLESHGWVVQQTINYHQLPAFYEVQTVLNGGVAPPTDMGLACHPLVQEALVKADVAYRQVLEKKGLGDTLLTIAVHP